MLKVAVAVALMLSIASADFVLPTYDCMMHYKGDIMGIQSEVYLMQDISKGGDHYYYVQNMTYGGEPIGTTLINCDYVKNRHCLGITLEEGICGEDYDNDFPTRPMEIFYYDKKASCKCPFRSQTGCTKYTNTTNNWVMILDSKGHEVQTETSSSSFKLEYFDAPFSPAVFASHFCNGKPLDAPSNIC